MRLWEAGIGGGLGSVGTRSEKSAAGRCLYRESDWDAERSAVQHALQATSGCTYMIDSGRSVGDI